MKKIFTLLLISIASISFSQTPFVHYKLDGNANDNGLNQKNGIATATIPVPDRNNVTDGAIWLLSGNGSKIEIADTSNFGNGNGSLTIAAWFKNNGSGINSIFTSGLQGFAPGVFLSVGYSFYPGSITFGLAAGAAGNSNLVLICSDSNNYNDDNWHHVAVVVNKTTDIVQMYIDGALASFSKFSGFGITPGGTLQNSNLELNIAGVTSNNHPSQAYIGIGCSSGISQNYEGYIDELYYFKSALSASEIKTVVNGTIGTSIKNENKASIELSFYPNPTTNTAVIKNNTGKILKGDIYDINGRSIQTLETTGLYSNLDLSNLQNGIYMIRFENGNILKFIKE